MCVRYCSENSRLRASRSLPWIFRLSQWSSFLSISFRARSSVQGPSAIPAVISPTVPRCTRLKPGLRFQADLRLQAVECLPKRLGSTVGLKFCEEIHSSFNTPARSAMIVPLHVVWNNCAVRTTHLDLSLGTEPSGDSSYLPSSPTSSSPSLAACGKTRSQHWCRGFWQQQSDWPVT